MIMIIDPQECFRPRCVVESGIERDVSLSPVALPREDAGPFDR
jgi:hypothetical protein